MTVERVGVAFEPELLRKFDDMIKGMGYASRSEAVRDVVRKAIIESEINAEKGDVMGTITIIYDHRAGNVTDRLLRLQHHHQSEIISTTHIHASRRMCLEVIVVRGKAEDVKNLAGRLRATKGVKHGKLVMTKTEL